LSHESCTFPARIGLVDAIVLDNGFVRVAAVPELGGKIISLIRVESGCEYLLQPSNPERAWRPPSFGDKFEDWEPCGFDECMPTVAECLYTEAPFSGSRLPDHGDVWRLPSSVEVSGDQISLTTTLRSLPLRFTKKLRLRESTVRLDYEAINTSESTVKFLWSAHPLLRVEPGTEIILPEDVKEVEVGWSKDQRLGQGGDRCTWPNALDSSRRTVEINKVVSPETGRAEKLFTSRLSQGTCGVFQRQQNESIVFRFDTNLVPYVGIWICQGGWPASQPYKQFTVALEPCLGCPDSLAESIKRDECATLEAGATMQWWLEVEVNGGAPRFSADVDTYRTPMKEARKA